MLEHPSLALNFALLELLESNLEVLEHSGSHLFLNLLQPSLDFLLSLDILGERHFFTFLGNHPLCIAQVTDMQLDKSIEKCLQEALNNVLVVRIGEDVQKLFVREEEESWE
jgi:hypothetical protein